jgi:hypothetical protein
MLERALTLGEQPGLVEELGRLQVGETAMQICLGQIDNGLQQR